MTRAACDAVRLAVAAADGYNESRRKRTMAKPIIALMYDFDKTLSPRNMQEYGFMDGLDMTAEEFYQNHTSVR